MSSEAAAVPSFEVDVAVARGSGQVAARFAAGPGLTVLFGPSGAGKTTILQMIAGLVRPDRGTIRLAGTTLFDRVARVDRPPERRRIGFVFQDIRLFPHRRVRANLLWGQRLAPPAERWLGLDEAVAFLELGDLLDRWPRSLSGGEAQRVAIGRALLSAPRALLMDEPLSSLDRVRRDEVMRVIERIRDEIRLPILYVTHDVAEAERLETARIDIAAARG